MPVNGVTTDPRLLAVYDSESPRAGRLDWFDAHTHMGHNDPDERKATADEILEALTAAGVDRALIFAMHEPDGYAGPNDAVLAACAASGGRLASLSRIDPRADDALDEARRCLEAGTRGFKLHPRSDDFPLPHPVVEQVVALAHEHRLPVLFHAGRGIPHLGEAVAGYARLYPGAHVILAHAGISDLGSLDTVAAELPNLYFDTSWWLVSDLLQLFTTVPPGQILYASDAPYGAPRHGVWATMRIARAVGLPEPALRSIAGGQLTRLLDGEEPLDAGPAVGSASLGTRVVRLERTMTYTAGALTGSLRGVSPIEPLQLALYACLTTADDDEARLLGIVAGLLRIGLEIAQERPEEPLALIPPLVTALTLAGTPSAGVPDLAL